MENLQAGNHLINEKSPYLLQHAHNPVNWYPWSEEAFDRARKEDKPIFLSIGYSTCHWCHVMEHESFEDEEVAFLLNKQFISIKVDREERPDLDHVYMDVCHALTGSGGWPLTILMTPDQKPFYAGTYFPKHTMGDRIGMDRLLDVVSTKWREEKSEIINSAEEMTRAIRESIDDFHHHEMDDQILSRAFNTLEMSFDRKYGGFGKAPKFPSPHNLYFLLRYGVYNDVHKAIELVEKTLIHMYKGGIFDHIGYGFSRYSVDEKWLVPHFEKMLYDNALLLIVYAETYLQTKKEVYKEIGEKIYTFLMNDMKSPEGAFYTALDADSEGVEGKFYLWSIEEIEKLLNKNDAEFVLDTFNVTSQGNFEGKNILNLIHQPNLDEIDKKRLENCRKKLYEARDKRVHPSLDDKILTSQNGMMIVALSIAGKAFDKPEYIEAAEKTYQFIVDNLITKENRILARFRDNEAKYLGYLDDYAYFIWGLSELFLATGKEIYIQKAMDFNVRTLDLFEDADNGGFFFTGKDTEDLIMKTKDIYDGAIPSSNSVVTMNLIRLSEITDDIGLERVAGEQFNYFSSKINDSPNAYTFMLSAYMLKKIPRTKIVLVCESETKCMQHVHEALNKKFLPFTTAITLYKETLDNSGLFGGYDYYATPIAAYICADYECNDPLLTEAEILKEIERM